MNKYIGHPSQLAGVEEHMLLKGKGKGITLLETKNGCGLNVTFSADRAMDISRIDYLGFNMGFFAPCGYVAPQFYDCRENGFLKSFTAGFLTTCGLSAVGSPCIDGGEELPLHGNISNTPCENYSHFETENEIIINADIRDASLFGKKLILHRKYTVSKKENTVIINDSIENIGTDNTPCMILYHMNMGYPLLSENAVLNIPHNSVKPRNAHAAEDIKNCLKAEKPQRGYEERCYYYDVKERGGYASVGIYNNDIKKGVIISFEKNLLDCFTQWKMMGEGEYVMGLEPANCTPDGRAENRRCGTLKFISPGECYNTELKIKFTENGDDIKCL